MWVDLGLCATVSVRLLPSGLAGRRGQAYTRASHRALALRRPCKSAARTGQGREAFAVGHTKRVPPLQVGSAGIENNFQESNPGCGRERQLSMGEVVIAYRSNSRTMPGRSQRRVHHRPAVPFQTGSKVGVPAAGGDQGGQGVDRPGRVGPAPQAAPPWRPGYASGPAGSGGWLGRPGAGAGRSCRSQLQPAVSPAQAVRQSSGHGRW